MGLPLTDDARSNLIVKKIKESTLPFTVLFIFFVILTWRIVSPMSGPLVWSIMLSYFAYPLYKFIKDKLFKGKYVNTAAALTTVAILFFLVIPIFILLFFLTKEALKIYMFVVHSGILSSSYSEIIVWLSTLPAIGSVVDWLDLMSGTAIPDTIFNGAVNWLTRMATKLTSEIFGNAFKIFYLLMVVSVSSFFFVRDGQLVVSRIKDVLPLSTASKEDIVNRAAKMLRAVVYGIVFTAAVQGVLGGLGWRFVGLPNAVFFGFLMFVTGMIPFVGTPAVWIPGSIYLMMSGDIVSCVLLLLWGLCVVSTIDNFIRPYFISEGSQIHILLIFIGILGGLYNWGFLGLFIGPLVLSLAVFILDIYRGIIAEKKNGTLGSE